jgi:hypothetical protein
MDLIGHLAVIEESGVLAGDDLWGEQAVVAMLPNLAHCHQWAYEALWDAHRRSDATTARVLQSHMICDWVIHYGSKWTPVKERIGWAYDEMPKAAARLDSFMDHLSAHGLLREDPREVDSREHLERDFGHTAVECALDFRLAARYAGGPRLASIGREFQRFGEPGVADEFIAQVFHDLDGYTKEPPDVLRRTIDDFARWSGRVTRPYEFAAYTMIAKYGVEETDESLQFALDFLEVLSRNLDRSGTERMVSAIVERIADPELCIVPRYGGPDRIAGVREDAP